MPAFRINDRFVPNRNRSTPWSNLALLARVPAADMSMDHRGNGVIRSRRLPQPGPVPPLLLGLTNRRLHTFRTFPNVMAMTALRDRLARSPLTATGTDAGSDGVPPTALVGRWTPAPPSTILRQSSRKRACNALLL